MAQKPKKGEKSYLEQFAQILPSSVAFHFQELTGAPHEVSSSRVVWKSFETFVFKHHTHLFLVLGLQNGFQVYKLYDDGVSLCSIVNHTEDCPVAFVKVLSYPSDSLVRWPDKMHSGTNNNCSSGDSSNSSSSSSNSSSSNSNSGSNNVNIGSGKNRKNSSNNNNSSSFLGGFLAVASNAERNTFSRSCVKIFSIQSGKYVHTLRFKEPIRGIESGQFTLLVSLSKEIYVYKLTYHPALEFELVFQTPCYAQPDNYAVMALGPRWLAFPGCESKPPTPSHVSASPSLSPHVAGQPVASSDSLVNMAQGFASGIYTLGGIGRQRLTAMFQGDANIIPPIEEKMSSNPHAGTIVVRDIANQQILVHFKAHNSAISCLGFNKKGTLLVSVPEDGQYLSVFQVIRFPVESKNSELGRSRGASLTIVQLYLLFRGVTHATIRSLSFSSDNKWLSASSLKGTTHIFAISECGGPATAKHATEDPSSLITPTLEPSMCTASALARIKHGSGSDIAVVGAFHRLSTGDPIDHLVILNHQDLLTVHHLVALQSEKPPFTLGLDVHPMISWDLAPSFVKAPLLMPFFEDLDSRTKGRGKLKKTFALEPLAAPVASTVAGVNNNDLNSSGSIFSDDDDDGAFEDIAPAVIHASNESSSDVASRWLSHVELETSLPAVPIWSTPQFTILEFKRSKRPANPIDNLFIEDLPTESLKYEKYKSFSGMVTPNGSDSLDTQIECALEDFSNFGITPAGDMKSDGTFSLSSNAAALELRAAMLTINEGIQHFALPNASASAPASPSVSSKRFPLSSADDSGFVLPPSQVSPSFALPPSALPLPSEAVEPLPLSITHSATNSPLLSFFSGAPTESVAAPSHSPSFLPVVLNNTHSISPSLSASLSAFPSPSLGPSVASESPSFSSISPKSLMPATVPTSSTGPPAHNPSPSTHKRSRRRKGGGGGGDD